MDFNEDMENEEFIDEPESDEYELQQCVNEAVAFNLERVAECATYWAAHDADHITYRHKDTACRKLLLAVVDLVNAGWEAKGMEASDELRERRILEAPIRARDAKICEADHRVRDGGDRAYCAACKECPECGSIGEVSIYGKWVSCSNCKRGEKG